MHARRVFFMIIVASFLLACAPPREPPNLAGNQWLGYQPLYLADLSGCVECPFADQYYGGRAFKLTSMSAASVVARLFVNGQLDGALLTLDEAINLQSSSKIDLCVARVLSFSAGADAMLLANGVSFSKKPLVVGYEETALGGFFLNRALEFLGLSPSDIETKVLIPAEHVNAVANGSVDMVITYQPYIAQLQALGAEVIFDSSQIPYEIIDVLVMRNEVWRREQQMLEWLVSDLWESGVTQLHNRESASEAMLLNNTGLNSEELALALSGLDFPSYSRSLNFLEQDLDRSVTNLNIYMQNAKLIDSSAKLPSCYSLGGKR